MTRMFAESEAQRLTCSIKTNKMLHYFTAEPVDGKWCIFEHKSKQAPRLFEC